MDGLLVTFPVSGVQTWIWLPPLVAFVVSFFTSMVGISGAFLLLPFQMSVLHFTSPSVSGTNLVFNLVAAPGGIYRFCREGRMVWPLTGVIAVGTLPGIAAGYYVRTRWLPDPHAFKLFAGCVLLYIGYRVLSEFAPWRRSPAARPPSVRPHPLTPVLLGDAAVENLSVSPARVAFTFQGERYGFSTPAMFFLALAVGIIGGIYGIGGGALIAPFCVALFGLPVHAVAGAAIAGTLVTSVFGVLLYSLMPAPAGLAVRPDWALGLLFGVGGLVGMYCGAMFQRFVPQKTLKLLLGGVMLFLAARYIFPYFR